MNHQALGSHGSIQPIYNTVMITGNSLYIPKCTRDAPPTIPAVLLLYRPPYCPTTTRGIALQSCLDWHSCHLHSLPEYTGTSYEIYLLTNMAATFVISDWVASSWVQEQQYSLPRSNSCWAVSARPKWGEADLNTRIVENLKKLWNSQRRRNENDEKSVELTLEDY